MKRTVNAFILGAIAIIFTFDVFAYAVHNDTISEQITAWINQSTTNLVIFIGLVIIISTHFIFSKYND